MTPKGQSIVVRVGRYGSYLQRGDDTASLPEDTLPDELGVERATELLEAPSGDRQLGADPETELPVLLRNGRFGAYIQLGEAGEGKDKPRTSSLFSTMSPETVTLDEALELLTLPRTIGVDPSDKKPITAQLGRYGPYISKGTDSRTLEDEKQLFTVSLEAALSILAQPKQRRQRTAKAPLKELGDDRVSGKPIVVKEGRFGLYVTDGETNASLRQGDSLEGVDNERAQELLRLRREREELNPSKKTKKKVTKKAKKKVVAKKSPATKVASKKATAKKVTPKKVTSKTATGKKTAKKTSTKAKA